MCLEENYNAPFVYNSTMLVFNSKTKSVSSCKTNGSYRSQNNTVESA